MTSNTMVVPDWAEDLKREMFEAHRQTPLTDYKVVAKDLHPVTEFSTLFGEWEQRDNDIIIHLFPRAGVGDKWTDGQYLPKCRACKAEVPLPTTMRGLQPCDRCGHTGLLYIPGRREAPTPAAFPSRIAEMVKIAADKVWEGDIALELVPELQAYAMQFLGGASIDGFDQRGGMLDRFFENLDAIIEANKIEV